MNHIKPLSRIFLVLFLVVLVAGVSISALASSQVALADTTYYVANDGDDGDDGLTPETAWQTIAHVSAQTFEPGDSVLFRRGDTWRETLYVTSSGAPGAWLTFGAYGTGEKPRILGAERALGWTEVAPNTWQSSTPFDNPYQGGYSYAELFFEEGDGTTSWGRHREYDAGFSQMTAEYDWSWDANTIYVYAPSNPGSRYTAVEVPQRDSIIRLPNVDGSSVPPEDYVEYVAFDNLELMYAMRHGIYPGYNEVEAHGLRITNNHIGMIGVKGGSSAYCIAAWHSDMLIQNNEIHDCGRRGISIRTYTSFTPDLTISNVTIDGNQFANGFHTTGPDVGTEHSGHTLVNFTISNNFFDDSGRWSAGINDGCFASSCTSNIIYIAGSNSPFSTFYIYNNIVVGSTARAIQLVGVDDVYLYHNTVYASHPDAQPYGLVLFDDVTNIDMRNNIFHGTLVDDGNHYGRLVLDEDASSFAVRDYNLYFQEDFGQPLTGSENGVGGWNVFVDDWEDWKLDSGFEMTSPDPQRPLFVDRDNGDFRLQAGSPAIDAGVAIPGFNDGYQGDAPDLGAIEFTPSLTLQGSPADQTIYLAWDLNRSVPATTTWQIDFYTTTNNIFTATDPLSTTRAYTLTGLTNYVGYTVTLNAMLDSSILLSDTIIIMPTDIAQFLPIILRPD